AQYICADPTAGRYSHALARALGSGAQQAHHALPEVLLFLRQLARIGLSEPGEMRLDDGDGAADVIQLHESMEEIPRGAADIGMFSREPLRRSFKYALLRGARAGQVALHLQRLRKVVQNGERVGMLRPEHAFDRRERALFTGARSIEISLIAQDRGEIHQY